VAGSRGALIHWDGTGWTSVTSPTLFDLNGVWGDKESGTVWAVGDGGTILLFN
jgi:hypothetical protein